MPASDGVHGQIEARPREFGDVPWRDVMRLLGVSDAAVAVLAENAGGFRADSGCDWGDDDLRARILGEWQETAGESGASGSSIRMGQVLGGVWNEVCCCPVRAGDERVVIVTARPSREREGDEARFAEHHDLGPLARLSGQRLRVLALIGRGLTMKQIGTAMNRAPKTIEQHRRVLSQELGVSSRVELAIIARRAGLSAYLAGLERRASPRAGTMRGALSGQQRDHAPHARGD